MEESFSKPLPQFQQVDEKNGCGQSWDPEPKSIEPMIIKKSSEERWELNIIF